MKLRAVLTVTVNTEGDYYADHGDMVRHVIPWIEGTLEDRDDIREVTIAEAEHTAAAVGTAAGQDQPQDRTGIEHAQGIAHRLAAHAAGFQDVLDDTDRGPWARTVGADITALCTALDELAAPALPASRTGQDEPPLSPDYTHPACGFHWHGRDGMDIPVRDGQPVCPRCELARLRAELAQARSAVAELGQAIRLTREYVGEELLPAVEGWSWYDALRRYAPAELGGEPHRMATEAQQAGHPQPATGEPPARAHLRTRSNAEDCPACEGTNPPYPFLCPGPTATEEPTS